MSTGQKLMRINHEPSPADEKGNRLLVSSRVSMPETRALHQLKATRQTPRKPRARYREQIARSVCSPTLRRAWPRDGPEAAICVQDIDVQCVLQFTLIHAASCALHRRTSRVIHRSKLFSSTFCFSFFNLRKEKEKNCE